MTEIELFAKIVEVKVRQAHTHYLKNLKRVPLPTDKKRIFRLRHVPVEDKLLKAYNAGIEKAIHILKQEYGRFDRRLRKEEKQEIKGASKF